MIIKVCGIKTIENINFLKDTEIDMVGLNFYPPGVRYISENTEPSIFDKLPKKIKRVGVFVNASKSFILEKVEKYHLDYAQLHGDESPEFCQSISSFIPTIKVFRIHQDFDYNLPDDYASVDYFLFDTHTKQFGGSGKKFDWDTLSLYTGSKPFLLSGGIGPEDVDAIKGIQNSNFKGIDINSKFENQPGIKDEKLLEPFIKSLKVN